MSSALRPLAPSVLFLLVACTTAMPPPAVAPPAPAALQHLVIDQGAPGVTVTSDANMTTFRLVFERSLGRAGFRVRHAGDARDGRNFAITLVGDGSSTSGVIGRTSYAFQFNKIDATVSVDGELVNEIHTRVSYNIVAAHTESFEAFNARVAAAASQGYEVMAVDLSNHFVASLH